MQRKSEKTGKRINFGIFGAKESGNPFAACPAGDADRTERFWLFTISDISLLRAKASGLGGNSEDCCLSVTESTRGTIPFCCVCMYGGFGYAELRGGGADGRPVFDDVYGQVAGPFFNICIQIHHSPFSRSQCI